MGTKLSFQLIYFSPHITLAIWPTFILLFVPCSSCAKGFLQSNIGFTLTAHLLYDVVFFLGLCNVTALGRVESRQNKIR